MTVAEWSLATPLGHEAFPDRWEPGSPARIDRGAAARLPGILVLVFGCLPLVSGPSDRVVSFDFIGFWLFGPADGFAYSLIEQADVALRLIRGSASLAATSWRMTWGLGDDRTCPPEREPAGLVPGRGASVSFTNGSMVLGDAKLRVGQRALVSPAGRMLSGSWTARRSSRSRS